MKRITRFCRAWRKQSEPLSTFLTVTALKPISINKPYVHIKDTNTIDNYVDIEFDCPCLSFRHQLTHIGAIVQFNKITTKLPEARNKLIIHHLNILKKCNDLCIFDIPQSNFF